MLFAVLRPADVQMKCSSCFLIIEESYLLMSTSYSETSLTGNKSHPGSAS